MKKTTRKFKHTLLAVALAIGVAGTGIAATMASPAVADGGPGISRTTAEGDASIALGVERPEANGSDSIATGDSPPAVPQAGETGSEVAKDSAASIDSHKTATDPDTKETAGKKAPVNQSAKNMADKKRRLIKQIRRLVIAKKQ